METPASPHWPPTVARNTQHWENRKDPDPDYTPVGVLLGVIVSVLSRNLA